MCKVKSYGFLIYRDCPGAGRSFLLMRHHDRWDLPKGHLDPGESPLECALRELDEETGIQSDKIRICDGFEFIHKYTVPGVRYDLEEPQEKKLTIYLGELICDVEIVLTEHIGFEWIDWAPPHAIQQTTIDPLLTQLAEHWEEL